MSKKHQRNLEVLSRIDEKIIDEATRERAGLLAALKKRMKRVWIVRASAMAACLCLIAASVLILAKVFAKQVPVYTGMTVSNTAPTVTASAKLPAYFDPGNGNGNAYGNKHLHGNHTGADNTIGEEPFDQPITDAIGGSFSPESAEPRYYAKPNEDIYITVHIDNPDNFVILSFTLNGEMYSSYMFEQGSDLENLILKVNVGNAEGMISYTIDAIKYIDDDNEIKDAEFGGDRTVEVGVYTEKQPTVGVTGEEVAYNTVSFMANAQDALGLIGLSGGKVEAVLYDGATIVATKELAAIGTTAVTFEGLRTGTLYQYAIVATYDALDGQGTVSHVISERAFYTKSIVLFDDVTFDTTTVSFGYLWDVDFADKTITALSLYQNGALVREIEPTALTVTGLLPDTEYVLTAAYQNGSVGETISITFKTDMLTYTVRHLLENLDGSYHEIATATETVALGATIAPPTNTYEGFTTPVAQSIVAEADKALLIEYRYVRNSYDVTFIGNDGTTSTESLKFGAALLAAAREGFYFDGFYAEETFATAITHVPARALTVFAKWLPETTTADLRYAVDGDTVLITGLINTALETLHVPTYIGGKPVTRIADAAFLNALSLVEVILPDTVTEIGMNAFGGCNALTALTVPHTGYSATQSTYIGYWFGAPAATGQSVYIPSSLRTVTVTRHVGDHAFYGCALLGAVRVGDGVTAIGDFAFTDCAAMTSITVPAGINAIGESAFAGCTGLTKVVISDLAAWCGIAFENASANPLTVAGHLFIDENEITALEIPAGVTTLGKYAFHGAASITSVTLPASVKEIGEGAFLGCTALAKVIVSDLAAWCDITFENESANPLSIAGHLFIGESEITALEIPTGVTSIGKYAFCGAASITSVTIPASVTEIGTDAFTGCTGLIAASIPTTAISAIPKDNLITVIINGGDSIPADAFKNCTTMKSMVIGDSVTTIGASALAGCTGLEALTLPFTGASREGTENTHFGYLFGAATYNEQKDLIPTSLKNVVLTASAVPENAFLGCTGIERVELTAAVTVGRGAFNMCTSLRAIVLPETLREIHNFAFAACRALTEIKLPASLTRIAYQAFKNCTSLTEIHIPAGVIEIGTTVTEGSTAVYNPFAGCTGLVSITVAAENTVYHAVDNCLIHVETKTLVAGCKASAIPADTLAIGIGAFEAQSDLTSMLLPVGLASIDFHAFKDCSALTSIDIPASVLTIGSYAFEDCAELTTFILREGLVSIGNYAFESCVKLLAITVPASVETIGSYAFAKCTELTTVTFAAGSKLTSIGRIFEGCVKLQAIEIPEGVTEIKTAAFNGCTALVSVSLPSTLTSIASGSFMDCVSLTVLEIPAGVTSVGSTAFKNVSNLVELTLPAAATYAFVNIAKTKLERLTVNAAGTVYANSFKNCTSLTTLVLPSDVTVGSGAFAGCMGITAATMPTTAIAALPKINLKTVVLNGGEGIPENAFRSATKLESITIPEGVREIGNNAFYGCTALTGIAIPASVTSVGASAFYGMGLTKVVISDLAAWCGIAFENATANPLYIAKHLFIGDTEITALEIPAGVTTIGAYAFYNAASITSVTIPASVTEIGSNAFSGCTGITAVTMPTTAITAIPKNNLTTVVLCGGDSIPEGAFKGCTKLESITIPEGIREIGDDAFYGCTALTNIAIPASVTSIGTDAFNGCTGLAKVVIADLAAWCGISFVNYSANPLCYAKHLYLGENEITALEIPASVTSIADRAFDGCEGFTSITLHSGVTSIGSYAFRDCKGVASIMIPASVTSVGSNAFYACTGLTNVTVQATTTVLGEKAFGACSNIVTATIPTTAIAAIPKTNLKTVILCGGESIPENAFWNYVKLSSITISASVKEIGNNAFYGCTNLAKVVIEDLPAWCGITFATLNDNPLTIAGHLYLGDTEITALEIPLDVTSIGRYAFYGAVGLTSITIHAGVTSIGVSAFAGCTNITTATMPTTAIAAIPKDNLTTVVLCGGDIIPEGAFENATKLESITIPASVKKIGSGAFSGCIGITSITIPASVTTIGTDAFAGCTGLAKVVILDLAAWCGITFENENANPLSVAGHLFVGDTEITALEIPASVTTLGKYAFYNAKSFTSIMIPAGVTEVGTDAFAGCTNITAATMPTTAITAIPKDNLTTVVLCGGDIIPEGAFENATKLESITIPASVKEIGSGAFSGCIGITSITIPASVTTIGTDAFAGCTGLAKVVIFDLAAWCGISFANYSANPLYYAKHLYLGDTEITALEIPAGVTKIGAYTFYGAASITSITIPAGVTSIGTGALSGCIGITSIDIPASVTTIGSNAFNGCTGLAKVVISDLAAWCGISFGNGAANPLYYTLHNEGNLYLGDAAITALEIPAGVTKINAYAFYRAVNLTSIVIPDSVVSLGSYAFADCRNLLSLTLGSSVKSVGSYAFIGCAALQSVIIPAGVERIADNAFSHCTGITSATMPTTAITAIPKDNLTTVVISGGTSIPKNAYKNCTGLVSVTILEGVTSIGEYAFSGCTGLTSIDIPASVTEIGNYAFSGCTGLTDVTIPASATSIGEYAFTGCTGITNVIMPATAIRKIPQNSLKTVVLNGGTDIPPMAFDGCETLTSITIPASVTSIAWDAFRGCNLSKVVIEDLAVWCGITYYEGGYEEDVLCTPLLNVEHFYLGQNEITALEIPTSVTSIASLAFYGCKGITSVVIPEGVTEIGARAFAGCTALASITIPASVTSIGESAFEGCTGLTKVVISDLAAWCGITFGDAYANPLYYAKHLYLGDTEITALEIPAGVTSIGKYAFNGCTGITSIKLHADVVKIANSAFSECTKLKKVIVEDLAAFCAINTVDMNWLMTSDYAFHYDYQLYLRDTEVTSLVIPEGVTAIGGAFGHCISITSITVPESVTRIAKGAFSNCSNFTEASFAKTEGWQYQSFSDSWLDLEGTDDDRWYYLRLGHAFKREATA